MGGATTARRATSANSIGNSRISAEASASRRTAGRGGPHSPTICSLIAVIGDNSDARHAGYHAAVAATPVTIPPANKTAQPGHAPHPNSRPSSHNTPSVTPNPPATPAPSAKPATTPKPTKKP